MKQRSNLQMLILTALFAAFIAAGAFVKIPMGVMPITLQVSFVTLAGMLLGKKYGMFSVIIYVILGLAGLPIFSKGGGIGYVLQPSFGYLIGFIGAAFVTGYVTYKKPTLTIGRLIGANFAGLAVIYSVALLYVYIMCNYVLNTPIGVGPMFFNYFVLFFPGDAVLGIGCAFLAKRLIPLLRKRTHTD